MVQGQEDMRVRIQNEFRWETAGEGVDFEPVGKHGKKVNLIMLMVQPMKDVWGLSPILTHRRDQIMYGQSQNMKLI